MNADASTRGGGSADRSTPPSLAADDRPLRLDDPRTIQILATEHWSLLAARTLSWNESFSRTSMLLATLSATVVALAVAAQVAEFGPVFVAFALVVLPFVELVGAATFARLGEANGEDLQSIQGMNRIRHAYVEIAPQLEPYFVAGRNDDLSALFSAYGMRPGSTSSVRGGLHHAFVMTQGMVAIINSMVAAVFGALLAIQAGAPAAVAVGAGGLFLAVTLGGQLAYGLWTFRRVRERMTVHFPSSSGDHTAGSTPATRTSAQDRRVIRVSAPPSPGAWSRAAPSGRTEAPSDSWCSPPSPIKERPRGRKGAIRHRRSRRSALAERRGLSGA